MPSSSHGFLTVAAAAKELNVSSSTIYAWARSGRIDSIRLPNGQLAISQKSINAAFADALEALGVPKWYGHRQVLSDRTKRQIKHGQPKRILQAVAEAVKHASR